LFLSFAAGHNERYSVTAFYKKILYRLLHIPMKSLMLKPQPKPMVFLGAGSTAQLCQTIAGFGLKKILLVTDEPLHDLGVTQSAMDALHGEGVRVVVFTEVVPDPTQTIVDNGIARFTEAGCDGVLAFGGGSSIDAAKVIALGAANACSAEACTGLNKCKRAAVPLFAVPTTAGTGSEATFIAVISDDETHEKGAVIDASLIPKAVALDAQVMRGLPADITAATGMDALTHAIESYIGKWQTEDTDYYGLAACRLVFENLEEACLNGENLEARESMAVASYYGGLAITNALVGYVHALSHNLGAKYGIPHGLANAMLLPHVLELMLPVAAEKLADIAVYCEMGSRDEPAAELAKKFIAKVWALSDAIGIPRTTEVIKTEHVSGLIDAALAEGGAYPVPRFLSAKECRGVIEAISA